MYLTKEQVKQLAFECVPQDSELTTTKELIIKTDWFYIDEDNSIEINSTDENSNEDNPKIDSVLLSKAAKNFSRYCPFVTSIIIDISTPFDIVSYEELHLNIKSGFIQILSNLAPQTNKLRIEMRTYQEDAEQMYKTNWQDALSKCFVATMNQFSSILPEFVNAKEVVLYLPDAGGIYEDINFISVQEAYINEQAINDFILNLTSLKKITHAGILIEEFPYHSSEGTKNLKDNLINFITNNKSLTSLCFYSESFLASGFMPLAQAITQHGSLEHIELQILGLDPHDVLDFLAPNKNLKSICLLNINFNNERNPNASAQLLGQAIKANRQLQQLCLSAMYQQQRSHFPYKPIADAVATHSSLENFNFWVSVSQADIEYAQSVCSKNKLLTSLSFGDAIAKRNLEKMALMDRIKTPSSATNLSNNNSLAHMCALNTWLIHAITKKVAVQSTQDHVLPDNKKKAELMDAFIGKLFVHQKTVPDTNNVIASFLTKQELGKISQVTGGLFYKKDNDVRTRSLANSQFSTMASCFSTTKPQDEIQQTYKRQKTSHHQPSESTAVEEADDFEAPRSLSPMFCE